MRRYGIVFGDRIRIIEAPNDRDAAIEAERIVRSLHSPKDLTYWIEYTIYEMRDVAGACIAIIPTDSDTSAS